MKNTLYSVIASLILAYNIFASDGELDLSRFNESVRFDVQKALHLKTSSKIGNEYLLMMSYDLKEWIPLQISIAAGSYVAFVVLIPENNDAIFFKILTTTNKSNK